MLTANSTARGGNGEGFTTAAGRPALATRCARYQLPTCQSTAIAISAAAENAATLGRPNGMMTQAAASGPMAWPALPPTWKIDWAKPWRPPEASRAMREDSGWKIAEPVPTKAAATKTMA